MEEKIIKIGMVGCGWISEYGHIPGFKAIPNCMVTALFDHDEKRIREQAGKLKKVDVFTEYQEFLNSDIDAVVICTPNYTHKEFSIRALKAKKHVMCEKPIALSTSEIEEMKRVEEENGVFLIPAFVNRFRSEIVTMLEKVESKEIGDVLHVKAGWTRKSGVPRAGSWFTSKGLSGGGALTDLGSHVVDICSMLTNQSKPMVACAELERTAKGLVDNQAKWFDREVIEERYEIDVEHTAWGFVKFENHISMDLTISWNYDSDGDSTYFKVIGDKGNIVLYSLFGFSQDRLYEKNTLTITDGVSTETIEYVDPNESQNIFSRQAENFVSCIRNGSSNNCSSDHAINMKRIIDSLYAHEISG